MTPLILFGAFDRHNFGDLLLAHVAAARFSDRPLVFAGLAERDMRPWGGHQVRAIAKLAKEWGDRPADLCHVGGEILTCSLYEAAVMVLQPDEAQVAIARYDRDLEARQAWAEDQLGLIQQTAYLVPKAIFPNPGSFSYLPVGGVGLPSLPAGMQAEVRTRLAEADGISVRDRITQSHLAAWGIHATLNPDPGERVAELFGPIITKHAATGATKATQEAFPQGYVAVQFSADFGNDATLQDLANQLDRIADDGDLGICLFRAGAAPWHDDEVVYHRLMGFMQTKQVRLFDSLHLWDICALLSQARIYCGSSLHGRIVARAFGVPGINLVHRDGIVLSKQRAYWETWLDGDAVRVCSAQNIHQTVMATLKLPGAASIR